MEALSGSLSRAGATVDGLSPQTKAAKVTYDPAKVTVHHLALVVADTDGPHKPYQAGLVVNLEDPKSVSKAPSALRRVKGVAGVTTAPDGEPGEILVTFAPLGRQARPNDFVKATQIAEALEKSHLKFTGLPAASTAAGPSDADAKKKVPSAKPSKKPKGDDDMPAEKTKPTRPTGSASKPKVTRDPATSTTKSKESDDEDAPRFKIQAVSGDKVYLVDHEAKLKKFVKEGDIFGEYLVKETADKDGWYVVLEHSATKETIRIEKDPKKDDKPKDEGEKVAKKDTPATPTPKKDSQPTPPAKPKDTKPAELPRFQILGEAKGSGKVYLADNQANTKKFVKAGDMFGDFIVKEVGDKDGPFVVLENATTKATVRVEEEKNEKGKPKEGKEKASDKQDSNSKAKDDEGNF